MKLPVEYYLSEDVVGIGKDLVGKKLCTNIDGKFTSGIIAETEAYAGINDQASHAWNNRRTKRTEVMYMKGGVAYIYLCYGIHHLFNVVTNREDIPHAVLIRSIIPIDGIEHMLKRRGMNKADAKLTSGPGSLSRALGITCDYAACDLTADTIWIEDGIKIPSTNITVSKRIGVDYAGKDAGLPYRFSLDKTAPCHITKATIN